MRIAINGDTMKKIIAVLLIITVLALAGCKPAPPAEAPTGTAGEVSEGISEVGTLDEDLDISDLDELDKELEDIT